MYAHKKMLLVLLTVAVFYLPLEKVSQADGPIRQQQYDPHAKQVELFQGIESGQIDYKLIMKGMNDGNLIVENKTDQTLTIEMPAAVAGVHIIPQTLTQFGNGSGVFGNSGNGSGNGNNNGNGQNGSGNGASQSVGGGLGSNGTGTSSNSTPGNNSSNGNPPGFFSIPAGKKFLFPLHTVCLEYGKPNPSVRATYKLVKVEQVTSDPKVIELLKMIGTEKIDTGTAQAASWFLTSNQSWQQLSDMRMGRLPQTRDFPVFSKEQMKLAKQLVVKAEEKALKNHSEEQVNKSKENSTQVKNVSTNSRLKLTARN